MSRITRREMKRDELVTTITAVTSVVDRHRKSLLIAAGAVVVLAAAVAGGFLYSGSRQRAAQGALADVIRASNAPIVTGETLATIPGAASYRSEEEKQRDVARLATEVVDAYPSTPAADWALYWKGLALEKISDHDGALVAIEPLLASPESSRLYPPAMLLKSKVLESRGDLAGAAQTCADLLASGREDFPVEIVLMERGRILEKQGNTDEAQAAYRRVTSEFPQSPYAQEATKRLGGGEAASSQL